MKTLALSAFLLASAAYAQSNKVSPRASSAPAQSTTTTAPSGTPMPEASACLTCTPARTPGQSSTIPNALHLTSCTGYQITICASSGQTLSGAGTIDIYYWPDWPGPLTLTTWPKDPGLVETVTATTRCQTFPTHTTTGLGWIYPAANAVTVSAGTTVNVLVEAVCTT